MPLLGKKWHIEWESHIGLWYQGVCIQLFVLPLHKLLITFEHVFACKLVIITYLTSLRIK